MWSSEGEYPLAQCGSSHTKRKGGCNECKQCTWQQEQTNTRKGENEKGNLKDLGFSLQQVGQFYPP